MRKVDLRKELKWLYSASPKQVEILDVPAMNFLMFDGAGDPNSEPAFHEAMGVLYGMAYTLKFLFKKGPEAIDYPVMPLEGLWWVEDMGCFEMDRKDDWLWTCMIMQPDFVTPAHVEEALEALRVKKDPPGLERLRYDSFHEGLCAQVMHIGPYAEEGPTVERLHDFITTNGYTLRGKHHEIYMGDPRRAAPEKLKTLIRQPMTPARR